MPKEDWGLFRVMRLMSPHRKKTNKNKTNRLMEDRLWSFLGSRKITVSSTVHWMGDADSIRSFKQEHVLTMSAD